MRITAIEAQKHRGGRTNICIDGKFSFSLDHETFLKERLVVGQQLTQVQITKIAEKGKIAHWYNMSLRFLSYRPRSIKELTDYLKKKKLDPTTLQSTIQRLIEKKFLDDTKFAQWFITQRTTFRPKGRKALILELKKKGITNDTIESVLSNENLDEVVLANRIAVKKLAALKRFSRIKQKEKLIAFLYRRGFSWDTIKQVLSLTKLTY